MIQEAPYSNESGLLTRAQAARYLTISPRNLDYLRAAGTMPFIQIGRRVLFSRLDLDQFVESRKVAVTG
jgi:excisionase family DNA binding protein